MPTQASALEGIGVEGGGLLGGLILAILSTVKTRWVRWPLIAWVDLFRALAGGYCLVQYAATADGDAANTLFIGQAVYTLQGTAGNIPLAAAFAVVPIAVMLVYLAVAKRMGAFDAL